MATRNESFLTEVGDCWSVLAASLAQSGEFPLAERAERLSRQLVELVLFLQLCRARHVAEPPVAMPVAGQATRGLTEWIAAAEEQTGAVLIGCDDIDLSTFAAADPSLAVVLARLNASRIGEHLTATPPEILGWVHERLRGLRLTSTPGRRVGETSRKARKMSGVFYTPDWVIRHMVAATLGRQLSPACLPPRTGCDSAMLGEQGGSLAFPAATKGKMSQSPAWERLRILDPACGCGFFLLGACRYLVEWYRQRGLHDAGHWVARSLHGADVDAEAVLAARRSLWLELVAGGPPESRGRVPASLAGEILTELTGNVRCGDALADSAGAEEPAGFDVVLGNPPYRRELNAKHLLDPLASTSWGRRHRAPRMDLWYYFVHRGLELLRPGGRLSFIVDSYWTASRGAAKLIAAIQESAWVEEIVSLGRASVFAGVSGRHMIFSLVKGPGRPMTTIKRAAAARVGDAEAILTGRLPLQVFQKTTAQLFRAGRIDLEPPAEELLARLARWRPLGKLGRVRQGIVENPADVTAKANRRHGVRWRTGEGVFVLTPAEAAALELPEVESQLLRAYHDLVDLGRYFLADPASRLLIYSTAETCPQIDAFPSLRSHLARFRPIMEDRRETRLERRPWWQLHWPRDETLWRAGKLLCVQMARRPVFVAAKAPVYVPFSVNVFVPHADTREDLDYLAVLLNSRLLWKWFSHHAKRRGVGLEINGHVLAEAPIRTIDFHCHSECHAHQRLVALGREMMQRTGRRRAADAAKNQTVSDHRLAEIDREIDRAVYALYGLTEAEIALVENAELAL